MTAAKGIVVGMIVLVCGFLGFLGYQYMLLQSTPVQAQTTESQSTSSGGSFSSASQTSAATGSSTTSSTSSSTTNSTTSSGTTTKPGPATVSNTRTTAATGSASSTGSSTSTTSTSSGSTTQKPATTTTTGTTATTGSSTTSGSTTTTSSTYKDGTYTGTGAGKKPGMQVQVVISGGRINGVSVLTSQDDQPYLNEAIAGMVPKIIGAQSTAVDTVSGATLSSRGILQGAAAALALAK